MTTDCQQTGCRRRPDHCADVFQAEVAPPGYDARVEIHGAAEAARVDFCVLIAWLEERGASARFLGMTSADWPVIAVFTDHHVATEFRLRWC